MRWFHALDHPTILGPQKARFQNPGKALVVVVRPPAALKAPGGPGWWKRYLPPLSTPFRIKGVGLRYRKSPLKLHLNHPFTSHQNPSIPAALTKTPTIELRASPRARANPSPRRHPPHGDYRGSIKEVSIEA